VFKPYTLRTVNGVTLAVIGQAFPYTPIANPRYMVEEWTFGIQEERLQRLVDEVRAKGAQAVVLLSHNGLEVDQKLAARVRGLDAILGGHTHDGIPAPFVVGQNAGHERRLERQVPRRARPGREGRPGIGLPLPAAAGLFESPARRRGDGRLHRRGTRAVSGEARGEARGHRGPALPPRHLQRHLGPAARGGAARGERGRHRVLTRLPLGLDAPARRRDHLRAPDGPDRDHLSAEHLERAHRRRRSRRSSRTSPTTPSIPIPTGSRAATWCAWAA
jgi:hypothetical protein